MAPLCGTIAEDNELYRLINVNLIFGATPSIGLSQTLIALLILRVMHSLNQPI